GFVGSRGNRSSRRSRRSRKAGYGQGNGGNEQAGGGPEQAEGRTFGVLAGRLGWLKVAVGLARHSPD
ncbi:MAG: hypothetical protein JWQ75_2237, partial [Pseudarthrobacter sp.]|nr:hypothetical protein [Pseudarthrobacter sp.]